LKDLLKQDWLMQPISFTIEYSLAMLWISWGINPGSMIGYGIGEYVGATISGVFSLNDALKIIAMRGKLTQSLPEGIMLSVPLSKEEIEVMNDSNISIVAINTSSLCVVSGNDDSIHQFEESLSNKGIVSHRLNTSHTLPSNMMDSILDSFEKVLDDVEINEPQIPYLSNVTGNWVDKRQVISPTYWVKHLRQPILFSECVKKLKKDEIFLEIGSEQTLSTFIRENLLDEQLTIFNSLPNLDEHYDEQEFMLHTAGKLWVNGVDIDYKRFYVNEQHCRVILPTYPFERNRYWIEALSENNSIDFKQI